MRFRNLDEFVALTPISMQGSKSKHAKQQGDLDLGEVGQGARVVELLIIEFKRMPRQDRKGGLKSIQILAE